MSIEGSTTVNADNRVSSEFRETVTLSNTTSQPQVYSETSGNYGILNSSNDSSNLTSEIPPSSRKKTLKSNHAALRAYQDFHLKGESSRNSSRPFAGNDNGSLENNSVDPFQVGQETLSQKGNHGKVCRFYHKYAFCKFGSNCRFLHEGRPNRPTLENVRVDRTPIASALYSSKSFVPKLSSQHKHETESKIPNATLACRCLKRYGRCDYGDGCKFDHTFSPIPQTNRQKKEHRGATLESEKHPQEASTTFQDAGILTKDILDCNAAVEVTLAVEKKSEVDIPVAFLDKLLAPSSKHKKPTARKRSCWYYKQYGTCKYGDHCKYQHGSHNQSDLTSAKQLATNTGLQVTTQEVELSSQDGSSGTTSSVPIFKTDNDVTADEIISAFDVPQVHIFPQTPSENKHPTHKPLAAVQVHQLEKLTNEDLNALRQTEIVQLKKRFPKCQVLQDDTSGSEFLMEFVPSDPDWPFEVKRLELKVSIPSEYPIQPCVIEVVDSNDRFPETLIRHLDQNMQNWLRNRHQETVALKKVEIVFKAFLRWLDRNLEDLFIGGLKKVKKEKEAEAAGIEFIPYENLQFVPVSESCDTTVLPDNETEQSPKISNDAPEQMSEPKAPPETAIQASTLKYGTEIVLRNLEFGDCAATLMCRKIAVTLQCGRCKNRNDIESPANRANNISCTRCHHVQTLTYRPQMMHQFGSVFGYLDMTGCQIVDMPIVRCSFDIGCLTCTKPMIINGLHYGQRSDNWCTYCNSKMTIFVNSVKFQQLQSSTNQGGKLHFLKLECKDKRVKDPAIQEGKPLPSNGTCNHFKKSYRWLRFPCCGKAYPCDKCHDEKETDHDMKYATRMICGFCAKEQPYANEKECVLCNSSMTRKSTTHWEGGKGCRDKSKMSRDDQHKYAGVNKTVSKKTQENKKPAKK